MQTLLNTKKGLLEELSKISIQDFREHTSEEKYKEKKDKQHSRPTQLIYSWFLEASRHKKIQIQKEELINLLVSKLGGDGQ